MPGKRISKLFKTRSCILYVNCQLVITNHSSVKSKSSRTLNFGEVSTKYRLGFGHWLFWSVTGDHHRPLLINFLAIFIIFQLQIESDSFETLSRGLGIGCVLQRFLLFEQESNERLRYNISFQIVWMLKQENRKHYNIILNIVYFQQFYINVWNFIRVFLNLKKPISNDFTSHALYVFWNVFSNWNWCQMFFHKMCT